MNMRVLVFLGLLFATLGTSIPAAQAKVPSRSVSTLVAQIAAPTDDIMPPVSGYRTYSICVDKANIYTGFDLNGSIVGTLYRGDLFVTEWSLDIQAYGTGYRKDGTYVGRGYIKRQYVLC